MAVKRVRDIELLLEFVQLATKEMIWMNQKEEEHANRDWSAKNLNIAELEKHYKVTDKWWFVFGFCRFWEEEAVKWNSCFGGNKQLIWFSLFCIIHLILIK